MNNSLLDERLKKSCGSRIAEDGKIDIMNEFRFAAEEIGLSPEDSGGTITFKGMDPIVNSTIPLGTGAAISLMLKALAATKVWRMRGGEGQDMSVEISKCIVIGQAAIVKAITGIATAITKPCETLASSAISLIMALNPPLSAIIRICQIRSTINPSKYK